MFFQKSKKDCFFIKNSVKHPYWIDVDVLRKFLGANGKIMPKRRSGLSTKYQRRVANEIKKARYMGLLPYIDYN